MDLFSMNKEEKLKKNAPLAERLRPKRLEDFIGQNHIIGEGKVLNRLIIADRVGSMIFFGPPGTGKTSLAKIISEYTGSEFEILSAVSAGIKDIKDVIEKAENSLGMYNKSTILFIDEIHRFNKTQQDALLPHVEKGLVTLIGATTENPFFSVNKALLSRCQVIELKFLTDKDIRLIIDRALKEDELLKNLNIVLEEDAMDYLIKSSKGDGRIALNSLEIASLSTPKSQGQTLIKREDMEDSIQKQVTSYDPDGDMHYNIISAFIKSIRGSDPNATVYYLARMLKGGEDPLFIGRRLIISAAEDVGLADPYALSLANATFNGVKNIGMPEARILLAECSIYLALAPKSNTAYKAINQAMDFVDKDSQRQIPKHLMDNSYMGSEFFDAQKDYLYPHDYENSYIKQSYLPEEVKQVFYQPKENGYEKELVKNDKIKKGEEHD